jgi:toxin YoeB
MVKWKLLYPKQAQKDAKKIASSGLRSKALQILDNASRRSIPRPAGI